MIHNYNGISINTRIQFAYNFANFIHKMTIFVLLIVFLLFLSLSVYVSTNTAMDFTKKILGTVHDGIQIEE